MKISLKYYILFFAVGMMSFVACSDDDDKDDPKPPNVVVPPAPPSTAERIISISNGDSANFTVISAVINMSGQTDDVIINGRNSADTESINIKFARTFKDTATYPQATEQVISYMKDGIQFGPTISGTLIVTRNDSIIAGTFEFEGEPLFGKDTLTVTGGEFYLEL